MLPTHYSAPEDFARFVRELPKTETHLHLEGSTPFELFQKLDPERYAQPPVFWDPAFRYKSFDEFMRLYEDYCIAFYNSAERYHEAAKIILRTCAEQGCRYVETSIHLPGLAHLRESGPEVLDAIHEAAPAGLEVRVFAGMCHNDYAAHGTLLESALGWDKLAGLDLHGPEYWPMESWTADLWERARGAGKFTKAHAGEFMPASYVSWVLDHLKVTRIEHGVRSIEDAAVVDRLVREGITLDICPISNVKLAVEGIPDMASHPIRRLFDAGVKVTVNSDDTFFFGNRLEEEYYALHQALGFSKKELVQIARNGFEIALVEPSMRQRFLEELETFAERECG